MKKLAVVAACVLSVVLTGVLVISFQYWKAAQQPPPPVVPSTSVPIRSTDPGQANLLVTLSVGLINARAQRPVDATHPVDEEILGTEVTGKSRTTGESTAQLEPSSDGAVLDIVFRGTAVSETVGQHRPITVETEGTTTIAARKRVVITGEGIKAAPAVAKAVTQTKTVGLQSDRDGKLGGKLVRRVAERRIDATRPESEGIAAKNTEKQVDQNMDTEVDKMVKEANEGFHQQLLQPLADRGLTPEELHFGTTKESLRVMVLWAQGVQSGAPGEPPPLEPAPDFGAQMHESFVNNLAAAQLSGQNLNQSTLRTLGTSLFGSLPDASEVDETLGAWSIEFAPTRPITIRLVDNSAQVTIRAQEFVRGTMTYPGMDIVAKYRFEVVDGEFKAVRDGNIRILPPGYGEGDKPLPIPAAIVCDILDYWFGNVLTKEVVQKGFTPRGKWSHIGTFEPLQAEAKDGWLVMGWKRVAEKEGS
jgi:hypothetical protein